MIRESVAMKTNNHITRQFANAAFIARVSEDVSHKVGNSCLSYGLIPILIPILRSVLFKRFNKSAVRVLYVTICHFTFGFLFGSFYVQLKRPNGH